MAQRILLTTDARQRFRTRLGGRLARIRAWWQPSDENWYLSIDDVTRGFSAYGVRLLENAVLLRDEPGFDGELWVIGRGPPGRRAWSTTHQLIYVP